MPICECCHKPFDVDDYMDSNISEAVICPNCYYSGSMMESDGDDEFDEMDEFNNEFENEDPDLEDENRYNDEVLSKMGDLEDDEFSDDDDLDAVESQFEREEGDYEE